MNSFAVRPQTLEGRVFQVGLIRRIDHWLNVMPHPPMVVEIASSHVAAARCGGTHGSIDVCAMEPLQIATIMPSPVENNITQPDAVRSALRAVLNRVPDHNSPITLLVPDPVVRVFILPFENLPRRAEEALPVLRWRLKKSVPFDVDDTVVSWMRQSGPQGNLEVVTAIARKGIIREYEEIVESVGARSVIVLSSTLASMPLLEDRGATMLVRISGKTLTTVIVNGSNLCVYRGTDMLAEADILEPQSVLEEIFPALAYYQDTWGSSVDRVRVAGFGDRQREFQDALQSETHLTIASLGEGEHARGLISPANDMIGQNLDALVGWALNQGA